MATAISINRAGKVRAQTPVVPRQEKPRQLFGAALKRAKYLKRLEMGWFDSNGKMKLNANTSTRN